MSFTTPCFIRKNTPELRKKLEELGYSFVPNGYGEWNVPIDKCEYLKVDSYKSNSYVGGGLYYYTGTVCKPNINPDCGTNEQLFLAIAALRDDSDYMQWFTDGVNWVLCTSAGFGVYWSTHKCAISLDTAHKATVEELIEHFKTKEQ